MDKREAARVPVRVPALCRAQGVLIDGFVENVSRTGLFLRRRSWWQRDRPRSSSSGGPGEPPLYLQGEIVRLERSPVRAGMGLRILVGGQDGRPLANFILRQHATLR